jgi:hypothetical protein
MRLATLALAVTLAGPVPGGACESESLGALLQEFLANADRRAAHERFWDEDLVYTSSSGTRFGKAEILAGLSDDGSAADGPVYSAREVDIRPYGEMAVVAFRLVATAADGSEESYFNTGTFLCGERGWQAVAWQATRIPADD